MRTCSGILTWCELQHGVKGTDEESYRKLENSSSYGSDEGRAKASIFQLCSSAQKGLKYKNNHNRDL